MDEPLLIALGIFGLCVLFLWLSFRMLRFKRLIENVQTCKAKGVFMGLCELKGKAETASPLVSFLAEKATVYYRYDVSEHWRRTVSYTDSNGRRRTRTESGWETVDSGERSEPFDLRDETGTVRIRPEGADIEPVAVFEKECGRRDALYFAKGPPGAVGNSTHRRRFTESAIPLGQSLYVLGTARPRQDIAAPEIAISSQREPFLISCREEAHIIRGKGAGAVLFFVLSLLAALAVPVVAPGPEASTFGELLLVRMDRLLLALGSLLALSVLLYGWLLYNDLVRVRNRLRNALSLIDIQLKRRRDLIPNLVRSVEAAARHERETQELVARARTAPRKASSRAPTIGSELAESEAVFSQLVAVVERHPELHSDRNFHALFESLTDTEDRIALARRYYNDCTAALRNRIHTFPDVIVAKLTGFKAGPALPELEA